tara:strand:+ start:485 stop:1507 length:1023 start_codon:yes stop_codon:yes gene_type:complete
MPSRIKKSAINSVVKKVLAERQRTQITKIVKRVLNEQEEAKAAGGSWPADPPKNLPVTEGGGPKPAEVVAVFKKMAAMGPPKDGAEQLAQIGGEKALAKNYLALQAQFKGSSKNPARIKMPVVDPDKDLDDLNNRLKKGALDLKPPYADIDLGGHKAKEAGAANRKDQIKITRSEALVRKIAKIVVERMNNLKEQDLDDVHPQGLNKMPKQVRADYLTKGLKDGETADDSAVTMTPAVITVGEALPTQSQVYIDKSLWNVMNFGGTAPGQKAFAKKNDIIAIESGGKAYILDGHHRWSSAFLSGGPSAKLDVNLIKGLDIAPAIAALRSYGNARGNKQKG